MPSFQARALGVVISLIGVRRMWDPERLERTISKDRRKGAAQPSAGLERRFVVRKEQVMGQDVFTLSPSGRVARRQILYLHGGGFVMSITEPHWGFIGEMADQLDAIMTVPIYPLAPECSMDDTLAALVPLYTNLVQQYPDTLTIMGDSSGANLALVLATIGRDQGSPLPAQIVLISPGVDFSFSDPAQLAIDKVDPILSLRGLRALGPIHAGSYDIRDPKISPLFANLRGLPSVAIFTGTRDLLNPDARALRTALTAVGNPPVFFEYPDMLHVWPLFPLPEARQARHQIADFVKQCEQAVTASV
ncbi:MAG: alpha/beta hydrolase [Pseudomonadota bacterium]